MCTTKPGETLLVTQGGARAEPRPAYPARPVRDAAWHAAYARMMKRMEQGIFIGPIGTITYEDRHGPAEL